MQLRTRLNINQDSHWLLRRLLAPLLTAGFLFFFIKGLLWLAIGGLVVIGIL